MSLHWLLFFRPLLLGSSTGIRKVAYPTHLGGRKRKKKTTFRQSLFDLYRSELAECFTSSQTFSCNPLSELRNAPIFHSRRKQAEMGANSRGKWAKAAFVVRVVVSLLFTMCWASERDTECSRVRAVCLSRRGEVSGVYPQGEASGVYLRRKVSRGLFSGSSCFGYASAMAAEQVLISQPMVSYSQTVRRNTHRV